MWNTQFGFRRQKSIAQALSITRRLQDIAEKSGEPSVMLFLEWEKAFDKIDQIESVKAIRRYNILEKYAEYSRASM